MKDGGGAGYLAETPGGGSSGIKARSLKRRFCVPFFRHGKIAACKASGLCLCYGPYIHFMPILPFGQAEAYETPLVQGHMVSNWKSVKLSRMEGVTYPGESSCRAKISNAAQGPTSTIAGGVGNAIDVGMCTGDDAAKAVEVVCIDTDPNTDIAPAVSETMLDDSIWPSGGQKCK